MSIVVPWKSQSQSFTLLTKLLKDYAWLSVHNICRVDLFYLKGSDTYRQFYFIKFSNGFTYGFTLFKYNKQTLYVSRLLQPLLSMALDTDSRRNTGDSDSTLSKGIDDAMNVKIVK